jgi:hypothetical protein
LSDAGVPGVARFGSLGAQTLTFLTSLGGGRDDTVAMRKNGVKELVTGMPEFKQD